MWGNRARRRDRHHDRSERTEDAAALEHLEPERPLPGRDDEADSLGWRADRHHRPEDWPVRPLGD